MRFVVYPHMLEIGGSQLNAIELAAAIRDLGHEVIVFGQPGPLAQRVDELGLELVAAPRPRGRPTPHVMRALNELVRRRRVDLVHGYEWTTALEAYWGPRARCGIPAIATVMSMAVAPFIPRDMPLVVGTEQIAERERLNGRRQVAVIEPPVDLVHNRPGAVDAAGFRGQHELDPAAVLITSVTRFAFELKLEGILSAIDAVGALAETARIQLALVGDGPARERVAAAARRVNERAGRPIVVLTGQLQDPRPAYAAADVCLAMGGSALRAMAFGRPLIVQGEEGFWEVLTPASLEGFLWTGWYGIGAGPHEGPARLRACLGPLLADPARRAEIGQYALRVVQERFSLRRAGERQLELYEAALAHAPIRRRPSLAPATASASGLAVYRCRRRFEQIVGRASIDDFNARPVAKLAR